MNGKDGNIKKTIHKAKLKPEVTEGIKIAVIYASVFISGFILTLGNILDGISPFGAAFSLSLPFAYMPSAAAGSILGYIISSGNEQCIRYICAIIIGAVILITFYKVLGKVLKNLFVAGIVFFCIAASGIATSIGLGLGAYEIMLSVAEGVFAACFCCFLKISMQCADRIREHKIIKSSNLAAIMTVFSVFLLSISSFKIYNVSFAGIIGSFIIIICAVYGRETSGAISGTALGCVLGFGNNLYTTGAAYSLGGLIAGLCSSFGKFAGIAGYIVGQGCILLFSEDTEMIIPKMTEAGIAAVAVILLPKKANEFFSSFFVKPGISPDADSMRELLSFKLRTASATVYEVSGAVKAVSKALAGINKRNEKTVYDEVQEEVCHDCRRKNNCWEYNFEKTIDSFNRLTMSRKNGETPTVNSLPVYLASGCLYIEELTESFNKNYTDREYKDAVDNQISEARAVAAEQFTSISVMLENLAEELQRDIIFSPDTARKATEALEYMGISVKDSVCIINEGGYAVLQVFCAAAKKKISSADLREAVCETTGIDFDGPVVGESDSEKILLLFCETPSCSVKASASQFIGEGQSVCGDAYDFFNDGRGHFVMILSDGMGTGSRAAVDGKMTTCLAAKLIKAGFSFDCVIKTVNSALMVKSKDESLSTLDIVSIDLYNGSATFYKAGAAASLICRRGKVLRIERSSLPLGILRDVEFERVTGKIGNGDIIVMMSDGVSSVSQDKLRQKLFELADKPPQEISSTVAALAREESALNKTDDITVITAVVHRK